MIVLGISGSLREGSYNTALLRAAGGLLPPGARLVQLGGVSSLPAYSEDLDITPAPAQIRTLRNEISAADALLIATPEYNASVPGHLKTALDWASRPFPDNALRHKPAVVIGASTGVFGAVWAQAEIRKILRTAGARVLDDELAVWDAPSAFDERLRLADSTFAGGLREALGNLIAAAGAEPPAKAA